MPAIFLPPGEESNVKRKPKCCRKQAGCRTDEKGTSRARASCCIPFAVAETHSQYVLAPQFPYTQAAMSPLTSTI